MLPSPPQSGSGRGSADAEGAGRCRSSGSPRPSAAGGGAAAHRGCSGAAPLTCRPARGPGGAEPPPGPRRPGRSPAPGPRAGSARCCNGRSARPWARPLTRAAPREAGEPLPLRPGWWGRGKAVEVKNFLSFLFGACGRWCSSEDVKGAGGT